MLFAKKTRQQQDRLMLKDKIRLGEFEITVSTVELPGTPLPGGYRYETIAFLSSRNPSIHADDNVIIARYRTADEAARGHHRAVEALRRNPHIIVVEKECRRVARFRF